MFKSDYMLENPLEPTVLTMEKSEGLGNQQENRIADLARLAMFVDTDGWITIRVHQKGKSRDANLSPMVGVVNTSKDLIEWVDAVMTKYDIPHHVSWIDFGKYVKTTCRKPQARVQIVGLRRIQKGLPMFIEYLVAKRKQADVLMKYVESRLSQSRKATYNDFDMECANQIRALNDNKTGAWRPISSETVRQNRELRLRLKDRYYCKIQSGLQGNLQSAAEMTAPTLG